FAFFPFVDMIVAAKLLIVIVWFGAGVSKLNRHFECVISPMVSNTPWLTSKAIKRMHYADFPRDLRPSKLAKRVSHGPGALGELRPDLVSFLPSLRQYAGNWASAMWMFAPGAEAKLNEHIIKPALMQKDQLSAIYGEEAAEVVMQQLLGWRSLHSQGRGLNSV